MRTLFLLIVFFAISATVSAQSYSLRGTNSSQLLRNGLYDPDLSHAVGGEFIFSKPIHFIKWPVNYNLGLDYRNTDNAHAGYLITGLTWVTRTPSGFMFATNAESVTYTTSNWLQYGSVNMFNGVLIGDTTYTYSLGVGFDYNFGYVFGKQFFVHWGLGGRYNLTPSYSAELDETHGSFEFMFKAGFLFKPKRKFNKP